MAIAQMSDRKGAGGKLKRSLRIAVEDADYVWVYGGALFARLRVSWKEGTGILKKTNSLSKTERDSIFPKCQVRSIAV